MMITFEDCLAFCGLTEAEILAIAEHEHIPEIAAAGLGRYLLDSPGGPERIREMILDDIARARRDGDTEHAHELAQVLRHFMKTHPEAGGAPVPRPRGHSRG